MCIYIYIYIYIYICIYIYIYNFKDPPNCGLTISILIPEKSPKKTIQFLLWDFDTP